MIAKLKKHKKLFEIAVVVVITLVAAFLSFFRLGDAYAPETDYIAGYRAQAKFSTTGDAPDTFLYYTGIQKSSNSGSITVYGNSGAHQKSIVTKRVTDGDMYRWNRLDLIAKYNYVRLEFKGTGTFYGLNLVDVYGYTVSTSDYGMTSTSTAFDNFASASSVTWTDGDYIMLKTKKLTSENGSASSEEAYALSAVTVDCEGTGSFEVLLCDTVRDKQLLSASETNVNERKAYSANARASFKDFSVSMSRNLNVIELGFMRNNTHVLMDFDEAQGNVYDGIEAVYDEQELFPERTDHMSGMIFDEIYFGRTAYEFITESTNVYEWTHPHLGKDIQTLGILMFGMNPFGWRFMSALFGVLIVPLSYALGRVLFKRMRYATLFAFLMTIEGIRLVQGRIGTVDSMLVFFILASYLAMFVFYRNARHGVSFWKWLLPLGIAGAMFGCGASVKWSGVYAGLGLFIIFVTVVVRMIYDHKKLVKPLVEASDKASVSTLRKKTTFAVISCVLTAFMCFIVLTIFIYVWAYVPHAVCEGVSDVNVLTATFDVLTLNLPTGEWSHLGTALYSANADKSDFARLVLRVTGNIFEYHSKLDATHYWSSSWYTWPVGYKPVFFSYADVAWGGDYARIYSAGVFAVWIAGLIAVLYYLTTFVVDKIRRRELTEATRTRNATAFFVAIGILANYLPWTIISRCTFIYHYYPTVPFVLMFVCLAVKDIDERSEGKRVAVLKNDERTVTMRLASVVAVSVVAISLLNFLVMFPMLTGLPISRELANFLYGWTGSL